MAGTRDFDDALNRLGSGADADYLFALLGFDFDDISTTPDFPVAYFYGNTAHAVFASEDQYDEYGTPTPAREFDAYHHAGKQFWKYIIAASTNWSGPRLKA